MTEAHGMQCAERCGVWGRSGTPRQQWAEEPYYTNHSTVPNILPSSAHPASNGQKNDTAAEGRPNCAEEGSIVSTV